MSYKRKNFHKYVSLITIIAFIFNNSIIYAAPSDRSLFKNKKVDYQKLSTQSEEHLQKRKSIFQGGNEKVEDQKRQAKQVLKQHLSDLSQIHIPAEFGRVIEVYQTENPTPQTENRLIVLIQDLHTNPEAQINLSKILELLIKDYNLSLVCSEGADKEVDTSSVSSFPDSQIREKVAKLFVNSGELTGEEYLSITKYPELPIWGIENRDIYFKNIIEFNRIMKFNPDSQVFISQTKKALEELKAKIYSKEILQIDQKETDYEAQKLQTDEYLKHLTSYIQKFTIPTQDYKNIFILTQAQEMEKTIDQQRIMQDTQNLLLNLQAVFSEKNLKTDLDSLILKAQLFKDQKISPFSFYSYLKDLALKHLKPASSIQDPASRMANYPHLNDFIDYLTKVNSLDSTKLFTEMEELTYEIKQRLAKTDQEKTLTQALRNIKFLNSFFNLKVSNEQLDYYLNNKETHKVSYFKDALTRLWKSDFHSNSFIDFNPTLIDSHLQELEDFYKTVKERDIAMFDNTVSELKNRNSKVTALIHGGFHTKGITRLLRDNSYSYIVVSPYSKTDIDEENYHFLLSGQRKPLSEIMKDYDFSDTLKQLGSTLRVILACDTDLDDAWNASSYAQELGPVGDLLGQMQNAMTLGERPDRISKWGVVTDMVIRKDAARGGYQIAIRKKGQPRKEIDVFFLTDDGILSESNKNNFYALAPEDEVFRYTKGVGISEEPMLASAEEDRRLPGLGGGGDWRAQFKQGESLLRLARLGRAEYQQAQGQLFQAFLSAREAKAPEEQRLKIRAALARAAVLLKLLDTLDKTSLRAAAAQALAELGNPAVLPKLRQTLENIPGPKTVVHEGDVREVPVEVDEYDRGTHITGVKMRPRQHRWTTEYDPDKEDRQTVKDTIVKLASMEATESTKGPTMFDGVTAYTIKELEDALGVLGGDREGSIHTVVSFITETPNLTQEDRETAMALAEKYGIRDEVESRLAQARQEAVQLYNLVIKDANRFFASDIKDAFSRYGDIAKENQARRKRMKDAWEEMKRKKRALTYGEYLERCSDKQKALIESTQLKKAWELKQYFDQAAPDSPLGQLAELLVTTSLDSVRKEELTEGAIRDDILKYVREWTTNPVVFAEIVKLLEHPTEKHIIRPILETAISRLNDRGISIIEEDMHNVDGLLMRVSMLLLEEFSIAFAEEFGPIFLSPYFESNGKIGKLSVEVDATLEPDVRNAMLAQGKNEEEIQTEIVKRAVAQAVRIGSVCDTILIKVRSSRHPVKGQTIDTIGLRVLYTLTALGFRVNYTVEFSPEEDRASQYVANLGLIKAKDLGIENHDGGRTSTFMSRVEAFVVDAKAGKKTEYMERYGEQISKLDKCVQFSGLINGIRAMRENYRLCWAQLEKYADGTEEIPAELVALGLKKELAGKMAETQKYYGLDIALTDIVSSTGTKTEFLSKYAPWAYFFACCGRLLYGYTITAPWEVIEKFIKAVESAKIQVKDNIGNFDDEALVNVIAELIMIIKEESQGQAFQDVTTDIDKAKRYAREAIAEWDTFMQTEAYQSMLQILDREADRALGKGFEIKSGEAATSLLVDAKSLILTTIAGTDVIAEMPKKLQAGIGNTRRSVVEYLRSIGFDVDTIDERGNIVYKGQHGSDGQNLNSDMNSDQGGRSMLCDVRTLAVNNVVWPEAVVDEEIFEKMVELRVWAPTLEMIHNVLPRLNWQKKEGRGFAGGINITEFPTTADEKVVGAVSMVLYCEDGRPVKQEVQFLEPGDIFVAPCGSYHTTAYIVQKAGVPGMRLCWVTKGHFQENKTDIQQWLGNGFWCDISIEDDNYKKSAIKKLIPGRFIGSREFPGMPFMPVFDLDGSFKGFEQNTNYEDSDMPKIVFVEPDRCLDEDGKTPIKMGLVEVWYEAVRDQQNHRAKRNSEGGRLLDDLLSEDFGGRLEKSTEGPYATLADEEFLASRYVGDKVVQGISMRVLAELNERRRGENLVIENDCDGLCNFVANRVATYIRENNKGGKPTVIVTVGGATPIGVYEELARMHKEKSLDFSNVIILHIAEYYIGPDYKGDWSGNENSHRYYMNAHLLGQVNIKSDNVYFLDGKAQDPVAECARFEQKIAEIKRSYGIDIVLLGIGQHGHMGYNERTIPLMKLGGEARDKAIRDFNEFVIKGDFDNCVAQIEALLKDRRRVRERLGYEIADEIEAKTGRAKEDTTDDLEQFNEKLKKQPCTIYVSDMSSEERKRLEDKFKDKDIPVIVVDYDEILTSRTHLVELTRASIVALAQSFDKLDRIPLQIFTMGNSTLMEADQILQMATGETKASAVMETIQGCLTSRIPSSLPARLHKNYWMVITPDTGYILDKKTLQNARKEEIFEKALSRGIEPQDFVRLYKRVGNKEEIFARLMRAVEEIGTPDGDLFTNTLEHAVDFWNESTVEVKNVTGKPVSYQKELSLADMVKDTLLDARDIASILEEDIGRLPWSAIDRVFRTVRRPPAPLPGEPIIDYHFNRIQHKEVANSLALRLAALAEQGEGGAAEMLLLAMERSSITDKPWIAEAAVRAAESIAGLKTRATVEGTPFRLAEVLIKLRDEERITEISRKDLIKKLKGLEHTIGERTLDREIKSLRLAGILTGKEDSYGIVRFAEEYKDITLAELDEISTAVENAGIPKGLKRWTLEDELGISKELDIKRAAADARRRQLAIQGALGKLAFHMFTQTTRAASDPTYDADTRVFNIKGSMQHAIDEQQRVLDSVECLRKAAESLREGRHDEYRMWIAKYGSITREIYRSLDHDYRNTDRAVESVSNFVNGLSSVIGARHIGAGWGGNIAVWVEEDDVPIVRRLIEEYVISDEYRQVLLDEDVPDDEVDGRIKEVLAGIQEYIPGPGAGVVLKGNIDDLIVALRDEDPREVQGLRELYGESTVELKGQSVPYYEVARQRYLTLLQEFKGQHPDASEIVVARSGGRVVFTGEHSDYHHGRVVNAPTLFDTLVVMARNQQSDDIEISTMEDMFPKRTYSPSELDIINVSKAELNKEEWYRYLAYTMYFLDRQIYQSTGETLDVRGLYIMVDGRPEYKALPVAAGISSSAALDVATSVVSLDTAGKQLTASQVTVAAQAAENAIGFPCGAQDPFGAMRGWLPGAEEGKMYAQVMDCLPMVDENGNPVFKAELVELPSNLRALLVNTGTKSVHTQLEFSIRFDEGMIGTLMLVHMLKKNPKYREFFTQFDDSAFIERFIQEHYTDAELGISIKPDNTGMFPLFYKPFYVSLAELHKIGLEITDEELRGMIAELPGAVTRGELEEILGGILYGEMMKMGGVTVENLNELIARLGRGTEKRFEPGTEERERLDEMGVDVLANALPSNVEIRMQEGQTIYTLSDGRTSVEVMPRGAMITRMTITRDDGTEYDVLKRPTSLVAGEPILDGGDPFIGPSVNRTLSRDGKHAEFEFQGETHRFPVNCGLITTIGSETFAVNIHGMLYDREWKAERVDIGESGIEGIKFTLDTKDHPDIRRAFGSFKISVTYFLQDGSPYRFYEVENYSDKPIIFAVGGHRWVVTQDRDQLIVRIPARKVLRHPANHFPEESPVNVEDPSIDPKLNLQEWTAVGDNDYDNAFSDLVADDDGMVRVEVIDPAAGLKFTFEQAAKALPWVVFWAPRGWQGAKAKHFAVEENATCPFGFNVYKDIPEATPIILQPGETWTGLAGMRVEEWDGREGLSALQAAAAKAIARNLQLPQTWTGEMGKRREWYFGIDMQLAENPDLLRRALSGETVIVDLPTEWTEGFGAEMGWGESWGGVLRGALEKAGYIVKENKDGVVGVGDFFIESYFAKRGDTFKSGRLHINLIPARYVILKAADGIDSPADFVRTVEDLLRQNMPVAVVEGEDGEIDALIEAITITRYTNLVSQGVIFSSLRGEEKNRLFWAMGVFDKNATLSQFGVQYFSVDQKVENARKIYEDLITAK